MVKQTTGERVAKPTLMKGRKSAEVNLHDVIQVISMISDHGELERLSDAAQADNVKVAIPPKTANLFKRFIASHKKMSVHPVGERVMSPMSTGDPYKCCGFQDH